MTAVVIGTVFLIAVYLILTQNNNGTLSAPGVITKIGDVYTGAVSTLMGRA